MKYSYGPRAGSWMTTERDVPASDGRSTARSFTHAAVVVETRVGLTQPSFIFVNGSRWTISRLSSRELTSHDVTVYRWLRQLDPYVSSAPSAYVSTAAAVEAGTASPTFATRGHSATADVP